MYEAVTTQEDLQCLKNKDIPYKVREDISHSLECRVITRAIPLLEKCGVSTSVVRKYPILSFNTIAEWLKKMKSSPNDCGRQLFVPCTPTQIAELDMQMKNEEEKNVCMKKNMKKRRMLSQH